MSENGSASAVLLNRLGEILGVIAESIGIAEKLQNSFPADRNKKLLSDVIDPIFHGLAEVHDSYLNIFNGAISIIPKDFVYINGEYVRLEKDNNRFITAEELKSLLEDMRFGFREKADEFEAKRTNIWMQAVVYLEAFGEGTLERGFIWSVLNYFVHDGEAGKPVQSILKDADVIADSGPDPSILRGTAVSITLHDIAEEENPREIRRMLISRKNQLSNRFADAARCYHHVVKYLKKHK